MPKSVQVRWIEHAESRALREFAALQRAASEPFVSVVYAKSGPAWFGWLRELGRPLTRPLGAARSPLAELTVPAQPRSAVAFDRVRAEAHDDRIPAAILITDIVGSTRLAAEMGDRNWRVLLDRHDDALRDQMKRFGGVEVGNRGDGVVAIFDTPARAVCCATAIADSIASLGMSLRCGLHFGKVHVKGSRISGIAAHVAARIAASARPGEALVSKTARDLVIGPGLVFEDRGVHRLRDVPEEIRLFSVRAIAAAKTADIADPKTGDRYRQPSPAPDGRSPVVARAAEPESAPAGYVANGLSRE